jgi:hypothetical protein
MLDVPVSSHTEHQWLTLHSQAHRPAPPPPTTTMNTNVTVTTPEMTPSPTLRPEVRRDHDISPVTPLPPPTDQHRPFSYEAPAPETQNQTQTQTQAEATPAPAPAPAPPTQTTPAPQSEVSQVSPAQVQAQAVPDVQIHAAPETPAAMETQQALPSPSAPQATTPAIQTEEPHASPPQEPTATATTTTSDPTPPTAAAAADDLPPFAPLTHQTYTHLPSSIPRITPAHLRCYTSHADSVWSNNRFQSLGCMVCASNAPDRKWTCAWCCLRVCVACSDKLVRVPGRRLDALLKEREGAGAGADEAGKEVEGGVGDVDVNTDADGYAALIYGADDDEALQREREQAQRMSSINEEEVHERGRPAERQPRVD